MSRVTFTFTATCPEGDYPLVVTAKLEAPAPECGDPGGWRLIEWDYLPYHRGDFSYSRDEFATAWGQARLDLAELMAGDAAILRYESERIEGSDRA